MRTIHSLFLFFVVLLVFFVSYDLSQRKKIAQLNESTNTAIKQQSTSRSISKTDIVQKNQKENQQSENQETAAQVFNKKFKKEVSEIAKIQNDTKLVQKRLKTFADSMTQENVRGLFEIISDDKKDDAQRALAVELLTIKNDTASLMALQNFVGNNTTINGTKWDRKKELETVLRAQAVESIASYPQKELALSTLSFLQHKVDDKFLADRIGRATINLSNKAPTLKEQDDSSLKKLIE